MTLILRMGKLRLRMAKILCQGLLAHREQSWVSNLCPSGTRILNHGSQPTSSRVQTLWVQEGGGAFLEAEMDNQA